MTNIALIDMDGTVADYVGQLFRDLNSLAGPMEPKYRPSHSSLSDLEKQPHLKSRMELIKRSPRWYRNLPPISEGMRVVQLLRETGFDLQVLTKGPWKNSKAWADKVKWCREHIPDAEVHITGSQTGKSLVYGKVFMDDYPAYLQGWLEHRPQGLAIMPVTRENRDAFRNHPQVFRLEDMTLQYCNLRDRLEEALER